MTPVALSDQERRALENLVAHPKDATVLRRAQALLWLNAGETVIEVATRLRVSRRTIYNWIQRFRSYSTVDLTTRLTESPWSGRPRTAGEVIEPLILAVIDRDPRELGYGATAWTALLLTRYLQKQHRSTISRQSVSRAMARLGLRRKRPRHRPARRPASWRRAHGGADGAAETVP